MASNLSQYETGRESAILAIGRGIPMAVPAYQCKQLGQVRGHMEGQTDSN